MVACEVPPPVVRDLVLVDEAEEQKHAIHLCLHSGKLVLDARAIRSAGLRGCELAHLPQPARQLEHELDTGEIEATILDEVLDLAQLLYVPI
jgi:hypothetical protein